MKILKHILFSLVLISTGIKQLDAMKRAKPDNGFDATKQIVKKIRNTDQTIHPDLIFTPDDAGYYAIIMQELSNLQDYLATINQAAVTGLAPFGTYYVPNLTTIELTTDAYAQSLAPMLYVLLSSKVSLIGKRMGVNVATLKISIDFDESNGVSFNAGAISANAELICNKGMLTLAVWHEGSKYLHLREGILDAAIAHELGHIFHQHQEEAIASEFEADRTAAHCMRFPKHMISTTFILPLAQRLFYSLSSAGNLYLSDEEKCSIACILSSTLIKKSHNLGMLGDSSHEQFAFNINRAVSILKNTQYPVRYAKPFFGEPRALDGDDMRQICTLIYHQLLACCIESIPLPDGENHISRITSHPSPGNRKNQLIRAIRPLF